MKVVEGVGQRREEWETPAWQAKVEVERRWRQVEWMVFWMRHILLWIRGVLLKTVGE